MILACGLAACSKLPVLPVLPQPKPEPTRVSVSLNAAATVNVDARGRSTPVVVRAYVLKNASAFEAADFFSLFERDKQVLGDLVVWREEVALMPGETRKLDVVEAEGKVVAVFAAFREIDRAVWRASVPVVASQNNQIVVRLQENRIELATNNVAASLMALPGSVAQPSLPVLSQPRIEPPVVTTPSISVPSMPATSIPSIPTPSIPATPLSVPTSPFSIPTR